jgi:hypothetical protein
VRIILFVALFLASALVDSVLEGMGWQEPAYKAGGGREP